MNVDDPSGRFLSGSKSQPAKIRKIRLTGQVDARSLRGGFRWFSELLSGKQPQYNYGTTHLECIRNIHEYPNICMA